MPSVRYIKAELISRDMKELERLKSILRHYNMPSGDKDEIVDLFRALKKERDELKDKLDSKSFEVLNEKTFAELQTLKELAKEYQEHVPHSHQRDNECRLCSKLKELIK